MGIKLDNPRKDSNTFYLAALDRYGNYSNPLEFTIQHPGIQKLILEEQDVQGLIGSLKINLPKPYTERSQEVYPETVSSEEKEILGYRLFIQELDYDTEEPIGEKEVIDYDMNQIEDNGIIYYQSETGKKLEVRVGCYDSVYHPAYNLALFESTISDPVIATTFKVERPDISEALIKPNDLTTTLQGTGLTQDDFGNGGIESTYTIQAGVWDDTANEPIVGGIGLAYNSEENDIDVQIVADRFRLFDPDVEPNGKALFATGTVDGTSQIYMNANNIAMIAENSNLSTSNFFELSGEGLSIDTPGLKLDKAGNAIFDGEVSSSQFSLTGGSFTINDTSLDYSITDYSMNFDSNGLAIDTPNFTLDKLGNAEFGGDLSGTSGTFTGELSAVSGAIQLKDFGDRGAIGVYNPANSEVVVTLGNGIDSQTSTVNEAGLLLSDLTGAPKVSLTVDNNSKEGELVLANDANTGSIGAHDGLYMRGGDVSQEIGGSIFLYDSSLGNSIEIVSDGNWESRTGENRIRIGEATGYDTGSWVIDIAYDYYTDVGSISADKIEAPTKNFKIHDPEPGKEEYYLYHSTVETNTPGDNIYRYEITIDSSLEMQIMLPSYFKYLNANAQIFVNQKDGFNEGYGIVDGNNLTIKAEAEGTYNILVIGTRKDEKGVEYWNGEEVHYTDVGDLDDAYEMNERVKKNKKGRNPEDVWRKNNKGR